MSGLKFNVEKTEVCIFHRRNLIKSNFELKRVRTMMKNTINKLGITFDSRLRWMAKSQPRILLTDMQGSILKG